MWNPAFSAAVNSYVIKTLLANDLSTYFINGKPTFINDPKRLPRNPPACIILENFAFENFISAVKLFANTSRRLETFLT